MSKESASPTLYQQQIHQSKYARWNEVEGRRETWEETVDRYVDFMIYYLGKHHTPLSEEDYSSVRSAIYRQDVLPSMRALMTAGPALERDEVAGYNCSYIAVNRQQAFDEAMYILMCGTGVGFSVENKHIVKLPTVPEEIHTCDDVLVVADSKVGWASAYRRLIALLYSGSEPKWDTSKVRPAGARLKTFGGRASGPQPLEELFQYTIETFRNAVGRRLTSVEAHGLMCKVGDIVVVGGVRRSALISLSDPEDGKMRDVKQGKWWEQNPHYALANNSAVWTTRPDAETFIDEWAALIRSKSGERGIFNRNAAKAKVASIDRDSGHDFGLNPCVTGNTWIHTSNGPVRALDLVGKPFTAVLNGQPYKSGEEGFWSNGTKDVLLISTKDGQQIRVTSNHKIMTKAGWVEAGNLTTDDSLVLNNHRTLANWKGRGTADEGWLLGYLVGDGTYGKYAIMDFWGDSATELSASAVTKIHSAVGGRSDLIGHTTKSGKIRVQSSRLTELAASYGIHRKSKFISKEVESASSEFTRAFLRGLFDADGSVQGGHIKGVSVRLSQSDLDRLKAAQRMLARLGIISTIYENRRLAGMRSLPNGKGGNAMYDCAANHELVIGNDSIREYSDLVGFSHPEKMTKLGNLLAGYKRNMNKTKFYSKVASVLPDGCEEVFDCSVPGPNAFDANGLYVHNCGEIILRDRQFCNLSQITVRPDETRDSLLEKVRIASIIGTMQSCMTRFRYLSPQWKKNCEEERLLGVGMTGVMDSDLLNGKGDHKDLATLLDELRATVTAVNVEYAEKLGVEVSKATTCMKPAGNSTQLVGSHGSGIHEAYGEYYIRRNRGNKNDPVSQLLHKWGVPCENEIAHPDSTWVFSYPMKAPESAILRSHRTAIDRLEHWLLFAEHWCDHNPSITISVEDHEWMEVGAWVYKHFDKMIGVTFLPSSNHTYKQAPYEEIDVEAYDALVEQTPTSIDWSLLKEFETSDQTEGVQELACTAGSCEL